MENKDLVKKKGQLTVDALRDQLMYKYSEVVKISQEKT